MPSIITIDGPAGAGKSTVAKLLAKKIGFSYLDTGAMYRALTLKALRGKVNLEEEDSLVALAMDTKIDLEDKPEGLLILLDGEDVSQEIRTPDVTNKTFYIARAPKVREIMVHWQRDIGSKRNVVVEGRDTGTVVFPKASYKFFLDADLNERSKRRLLELKSKGKEVNASSLTEELKERDDKDINRKVGPLKKADDALFIDTTHLSIEEVVNTLHRHIKKDG
ncbi:MAG: (d)CMP kinase [Candidatus Omnitrophica bacterium]|nr:(d)CMP kinase [Candidatus Omnitrophota bacterium]